ncbi:type IX secretion system sortase PorU [candidate division KSB1 bacterium]|nr:type IX secretion system sortase PorU [candidate division KSB1 bacterium]
MKNKGIWLVFLFLFLYNYGAQCKEVKNNAAVHILNTTGKSISFEMLLTAPEIDTLRLNGDEYLSVPIANASVEAAAGEPALPMIPVTIGIPAGAQIQHTIEVGDTRTLEGVLLPQPTWNEHNKLLDKQYTRDNQSYSNVQINPQDVIEIGEPGQMRDLQLVTIKLYPIQFIAAQNKILLHTSVRVKIQFVGGNIPASKPQAYTAAETELLSGAMLNFEQAKQWRIARTRSLAKKTSPFAGQQWLKIVIKDEGMYKITGKTLSDFAIDIKSIDPSKLRLYNNGGRELDRSEKAEPSEGLIENSMLVEAGNDGVFDALDYIVFYGKSVNNWEYDSERRGYFHYMNHYTDENVYWLSWSGYQNGKRMTIKTVGQDENLSPDPYYTSLAYYDQNDENFLSSGYEWFSQAMNSGTKYTFGIELPNAVPDNTLFRFQMYNNTTGAHQFVITVNGASLATFDSRGQGYTIWDRTKSSVIKSGFNSIQIQYDAQVEESQSYLDWIELVYERQFVAKDDMLEFFLEPYDNSKKIQVTGFSSNNIHIFDVSDFTNVKMLDNVKYENNSATFVEFKGSVTRQRLLAVSDNAFKTPVSVANVTFADLRNTNNGAEFLIITHDDFYDAAVKLAEHRQQHDGIVSLPVKILDIYNEFSWGLFDPLAIRHFIKYAYDNWSMLPVYVLLLGDGDYDYRNMISKDDKNWLPPFETETIDAINNRAVDDWFVYVTADNQYADLAIGRLPVDSEEEADIIVNKIINYETASFTSNGNGIDDWRNTITIVGDDEKTDGGGGHELDHTNDAETISEGNTYIPDTFNKVKIYLTEYPEVRGTSFLSAILKPQAADAIMKQINEGSLIINFLGHGNPTTWTHEYVLYEPRDFDKIRNDDRLAFWIAATCDFGRFDDPTERGLAEDLIVAKGRGAIGVLASTRKVYANLNAALNMEFYKQLFENPHLPKRLGVALLHAKINRGSDINNQKYVLLGDPTMRLVVPRYSAQITSISPDTIRALSKITVKGHVELDYVPYSGFNGKALVKAFDSKKNTVYNTDQGGVLNYMLPGNTIFRGTGAVKNGNFQVEFIVPKDITYGGNLGRISVYLVNSHASGNGYQEGLTVGGTANIQDALGPEINIGLENENFISSGFVSPKARLKIELNDPTSGINIAGEIGHNITMAVDDDDKITLTEFFQYDEGSYTTGSVVYDFANYSTAGENNESASYGLTEGLHQITVKAWDNSNNSSTANTELWVVPGDELHLKDVLNYPNPFANTTAFSFMANYNCLVTLKIYTVTGRMIRKFDEFPVTSNDLAIIPWDGFDEDGDIIANGVYFYKVTAKADINGEQKTSETIQKLVKME